MKTLIETGPKLTVAILFLGSTAAASATAADLRVPADYPTNRRRRHCLLFSSRIVLLLLALPTVVQAQFSYTTNNGTITITGYPGPSGAVTIPAIITGLPVTSIGADAFSYSYVTSITIPNSTTNIGNGAFSSCSILTAITVHASNPAFSSVDGVLFNQNQTTLIQYPAGKAGSQYTIPNSVTTIGDQAFSYNYGLTNIVTATNVTSVGDRAFYGCGLTSVTIHNSVTNIGDQAYGCFDLSAITVDALNPAYTSVGGILFNKNQTTLLQYPAGKAGSQYTIPNSVTNIGNWALSGCHLTSVSIPNSVTSIGNGAFSYCERLGSVQIPNSINTIGNDTFYGCWGLASVTIPNSVTTIGDQAFSGCTFLTSVMIPDSVTSIGNGAFYDCWRLSMITVDALNSAYISVGGVLFNKNQTALIQYPAGRTGSHYTIPNGVTTIGDQAFSYCSILTNVTIPDSVTSIGDQAFSYCSILTNVTIPNSVTSIGDQAFSGSRLTSVTIPNRVTRLGNGAFSDCEYLTNIVIPNSIPTIGDQAFSFCFNLTNITIPGSVTSIGDQAFYHCESLTNITISDSVTAIGDQAFSGCRRLASVIIPDSVTDLGGAAFAGCSGLTSVTIGNGVSSLVPAWMDVDSGVRVAVGAFEHCTSLTNISIPNSVTTIGDQAFSGCYSLSSVTIPNSVTRIGDQAFYTCSGLTNITIPSSVTSIGNGAFYVCYSLTAIRVEASNPTYSSVDGVLFDKNQTALIQYPAGKAGSQYTIPNTVTDLGGAAFAGCAGLTSVTIGNGVSRLVPGWMTISGGFLGYGPVTVGTFENCTSLTNITISDSVTWIGDRAFSDCYSLTGVAIPNSVTSLGNSAFADCTSLTSVYFQGNAPSLGGSSVFNNAINATVFYLPGTTGWAPTFGGRPTAFWVLPNPLILSFGSNFGVQSNGFGFIISWARNIPVVVEASTTLINPTWTPVSTNTLDSGSSYFSEPQRSNDPSRFYRLRSP